MIAKIRAKIRKSKYISGFCFVFFAMPAATKYPAITPMAMMIPYQAISNPKMEKADLLRCEILIPRLGNHISGIPNPSSLSQCFVLRMWLEIFPKYDTIRFVILSIHQL